MDETTSVVSPGVYQWTLRNGRRKETRTFEQGELSIDGEARLIGIGRKVGAVLGEAGYTFGQLGELFDDREEVDWVRVAALAEHMATYAPDLVAEMATVFLGIYPTDEDGNRNPDYDDELRFLRGALNVSKFVDMVRIFMAQNEYARLVAPFSVTLSEAMAAYGGPASVTPAEDLSAPSGPQAIVSTDGSVVELEESEPATLMSGEVQPSDSDSLTKDSSSTTSKTDEVPASADETKPEV